jgi:hypothetical protein
VDLYGRGAGCGKDLSGCYGKGEDVRDVGFGKLARTSRGGAS